MIVYHGTTFAFKEDVREFGVPAVSTMMKLLGSQSPPQPVALDPETANTHARAWAAYYLVQRTVEPKGIIVKARIDRRNVTLDGERMRATILPREILAIDTVEFPEFGAVKIENRRTADLATARQAIEAALGDHEKLTGKPVTQIAVTERRRRS